MPHFPWLTAIIFLPLAGGVSILACGPRPRLVRWIALAFMLADFSLILACWGIGLQPRAGTPWLLAEDYAWIEGFGIRFSLGLDGISLVLILLTALLGALCVLVSWRQIARRVRAFHFFLLAMESGILGVFLATDLFLFYLFWEVQLIPMFFLIGIWGHEKRVWATIKFVLYTVAGSLLLLVALIALYVLHGAQTGQYTFALSRLMETPLAPSVQGWLFSAFLLAFAIKIPAVPVHAWLPDAHTEAPTAGSVILAGLLLKTGAYALLRFGFPLFPQAARGATGLLLALGVIGLFYAAWIALAQKDMKRLVAYSSVAHMGLVIIGVAVWNSLTLSGAVLQMVNHGLTTSALFILVGMLDERVHSRELANFGGLWRKMPVFSAFFLLFAMASLGLPGLNNFTGEVLILIGAFRERPVVAGLGFAGLLLTVIYVLRLVQETLFGETRGEAIREKVLPDLTAREAAILIPLAALVVLIGLMPWPILDLFQGAVKDLVQGVPQ